MTSAEEYARVVELVHGGAASDEVLRAVVAFGEAIRRELVALGIPTPRSGIRLEFRREVLARAVEVELHKDRVIPPGPVES